MNTRALRTVMSVAFLVSLLAGCTPATSQPAATSAPAATTAPQPTSAPAAEPVTIRVITQFGIGAEPQPLLDEVAAEFNQEHPEIKVEFDWSGGTEFTEKYRAQLAAGTPYDIIWQNEGTAAVFAREGVTANITEYLNEMNYEGNAVWKDTIIPSILQRAWVEDGADGPGYYAVPDEQFIGGVFYNKALFEQYSVQVPHTWDEFLAACETFKTNGVECIAADGTVSYYNSLWFLYLAMRQVGCQVLYDTAMNKPGTSFDTPDFHAVADHVAELVSGGYLLKGFEGSAWPAGQMEFVQGNAAMMLMKSWLPGEMLANTPADFRYGFFAFPTLPDSKADQTAVQLKFNGYLVTKDAPHHDQAILFIKKLLSRSVQERYSARSYYPGVLPDLEMPAALADTLPVLEAAKSVEGYACDLDRDRYEWESNALQPASDKLLFGQITPDEFIAQLQADHETYWASQ